MPHWTPDGASVTFLSDRGGKLDVWSKRADGVGDASLVFAFDRFVAQGFWAPDGKWLVLRTGGTGGLQGGRDILAVRPGVDSAATPLLTADYDEVAPAVSPDSRWIAYASEETGRREVFVRPFPDVSGGKWQVSTQGGGAPLWAHNGRELFFDDANGDVVVAEVETEPRFRVGERRVLFRIGEQYEVPSYGGKWDITSDDRRFLMVRLAGAGQASDRRTILVENWLEELKEKAGKK